MNADRVRAELKETLRRLEERLPSNSKIVVNGEAWLDVQIVCSGSIPELGYQCCLAPGHKGKCWTDIKKVSFTPTKRR